ncbi:hypothetical protein Tco_1226775 [Tanacetum coccineum]
MSAYLKHMAGYKQSQLKNKSFTESQKLFDKAMTRINMFVDKDTELVKESSKKAEAEMAQESSLKRAGNELEQEKEKKQKIDDDQEEEMRKLINVMLRDFDIEDLETLWKLVKAKHGSTRLEEGYERVLWGDLRTMTRRQKRRKLSPTSRMMGQRTSILLAEETLVEEESCPIYDTDNEEEESMPVYDTNIEDVIEEEEGFVGKG